MIIESTENFRNYILSLDYDGIGPCVYTDALLEGVLTEVTTICKRCFKKKDVILYVETDEDDDNDEIECGIVFTTKEIVEWRMWGKKLVRIPYDQIEKVDYDKDDVLLHYAGAKHALYLGLDAAEEKYPKHMYNFIMDILEYDDEIEAPKHKWKNPLEINVPQLGSQNGESISIDLSKYTKGQELDIFKDILGKGKK